MFIERSGEPDSPPQAVAQNLVPPMLDPVLGDYQRNIAGARDPEVLSLFATAITVLKVRVQCRRVLSFDAIVYSWCNGSVGSTVCNARESCCCDVNCCTVSLCL